MKYYIDITLLADVEVGLHFLWQKVYQQTHLALVEMQDVKRTVPIAIAFPEYGTEMPCLGKKLRLIASEQDQLDALNIHKWLGRLSDYVHITTVREVPANVNSFIRFTRVQAKSNIERLARRKARREGIDEAKALELLSGFKEQKLTAPFVNLLSLSGGQKFRLFITKQVVEHPVAGAFSLYGLSATATVPNF